MLSNYKMEELNYKMPGIFVQRGKFGQNLYTINARPGKRVYQENLVKAKGQEFREWDPNKSKLGAALHKKISQIGIKQDSVILYLGASTGTTVSHVSDILTDGLVYALDFAPRVLRELVFLAKDRKNIVPLLENANKPDDYKDKISSVDVVFQDIAQKNQVEIFLKNCDAFLEKGGFGILALKARSVDVTKRPREIFKDVRITLEKHITVVDYRDLDPFEKDHALFVCKKK